MTYLTYDEYMTVQGLYMVTEDEFNARAPYADLIIDNWTLERVKKTVEAGKVLPKAVKLVYCQLIDNMEQINSTDERIQSFSNGQDTYTFGLSDSVRDMVWHHALEMLPVEWISACVMYEGGVEHEN